MNAYHPTRIWNIALGDAHAFHCHASRTAIMSAKNLAALNAKKVAHSFTCNQTPFYCLVKTNIFGLCSSYFLRQI